MKTSMDSTRAMRRGEAGRPALAAASAKAVEMLEPRLMMSRSWIPTGINPGSVPVLTGTEGADQYYIYQLLRPAGTTLMDVNGDGKDDNGKLVVYVQRAGLQPYRRVYAATRGPADNGVLPPEIIITAEGGDDSILIDVVPSVDAARGITAGAAQGRYSIDAGAGNDTVYGSNERDTIWGAGGNDVLDGDSGNDVVWGEAGADTIWGGRGSDAIIGGGGPDFLDGDEGRASIYAGSPPTNLAGEADTITGALGMDTLIGVAGPDVLMGGAGSDTFVTNLRYDFDHGAWWNNSWGVGESTANRVWILGGGGIDRAFVDPDMERVISSVEFMGARRPPATMLYPVPGATR